MTTMFKLRNMLTTLSFLTDDTSRSTGPNSTAALIEELGVFAAAVRERAKGLRFARRSMASDVLSLFAAGPLVEKVRTGELTPAAGGRAVRQLLCEVFGWDDCAAAVRAGALLGALEEKTSPLASALACGHTTFETWRVDRSRPIHREFWSVYTQMSPPAAVSAHIQRSIGAQLTGLVQPKSDRT